MQNIFGVERKESVEETSLYMGASIENNHLLAGLIERVNELEKCEIIR